MRVYNNFLIFIYFLLNFLRSPKAARVGVLQNEGELQTIKMFIRLPGVYNVGGECRRLGTNINSKLQMKKLGKVRKCDGGGRGKRQAIANGQTNKNNKYVYNCNLRLYCAKGRLK